MNISTKRLTIYLQPIFIIKLFNSKINNRRKLRAKLFFVYDDLSLNSNSLFIHYCELPTGHYIYLLYSRADNSLFFLLNDTNNDCRYLVI